MYKQFTFKKHGTTNLILHINIDEYVNSKEINSHILVQNSNIANWICIYSEDKFGSDYNISNKTIKEYLYKNLYLLDKIQDLILFYNSGYNYNTIEIYKTKLEILSLCNKTKKVIFLEIISFIETNLLT